MSKDSIGVAVIGAGMAGRSHIAGYRSASTIDGPELPPVRLVAVADANAPLAEATARRFGYQRAESSWQAVADADDIDVVSIVVANHLHREIAEGLLAAGKHVLCEKPMAPSVADAEAMVAAAAAAPAGTQAGVGFTFRRSPAIAAIAAMAGAGELGDLVHFNGHYWCDYGVDASGPMSWRYKGGPGSGALSDIGSHVIDLAEFVCGPITSITGGHLSTQITQRYLPTSAAVGHAAAELSDISEPVENEDLVAFTASFASGAVGTISASRVAAGHPNALGFELFGGSGAVTFDLERAGEYSWLNRSQGKGFQQVLVGPDQPYITGGLAMDFPGVGYGQNDLFVWQARAFLEQVAGVEGGLPRVPGFEHGLRNLTLLDAVVTSARSGGIEIKVS